MLWHAAPRTRAFSIYDSRHGAIDLDAISSIPGDFSGQNKMAYFTPQIETADRYASYLKHRISIADIIVTQVAIPESLTNSLEQQTLYHTPNQPKDVWKQAVWYSRRGKRWPKELKSLELHSDLLVGHIATGRDCKYENLDSWTGIKDSYVLKVQIDGEERSAMQWVFFSSEAKDKFEEECRGKIWHHGVGVLKSPPTAGDL